MGKTDQGDWVVTISTSCPIVIVVQTIGAKNSLAKVMAELHWIDQWRQIFRFKETFRADEYKAHKRVGQFEMISFCDVESTLLLQFQALFNF